MTVDAVVPDEPGVTDGTTGAETPAVVRERAHSLVEYLLAVRALIEKPVRTVPPADAFWQRDLPRHPACEVGSDEPGGSWLRVGRPAPPAPPPIPPVLAPYLVWDLSWSEPPRMVDGLEETDPEHAAFAQWMAEHWLAWSREAAAADATRRLHDRLYDLRYRVDIEASRVELVWGHAILDAELGGEPVRYPLIATPVIIEYDPEETTVRVAPLGPPRLQIDALSSVDDRRLADLLDLGGPSGEVDVDPWDAPERVDFAARAMRRLGLDPVVTDDPSATGPVVHDTGVLFVRPRQRMVRRFLEDMRDRLAGSPTAGIGALAGVLVHEPSRLRMPDDEDWTSHGRVGVGQASEASQRRRGRIGRLLMPMPTNDAQESIARRLAEHRNVAVQGPPGTGKTHTIRNLICHLVAHGKRVLVLAQKEDPLRVLRDGLPEEIQPLCLAILGRSVDQLAQLQIAARELSDRAATLDREAEAAWVRRLGEDIAQAQEDLARAQAELRAVAERESATYELWADADPQHAVMPTASLAPSALDRSDATASEVGEWLRRHEAADGFIADPIAPGTAPPLQPAELAEFGALATRTSTVDRAAALGVLPAPGQLPTGQLLGERAAALRDARKVVDALLDQGVAPDGVRRLGEEAIDDLARQLRVAADDLARREGSWIDRLGQLVRDPSWQAVWDDHVRSCQHLAAELARRTSLVAGRRVEIAQPHAAEPRHLLGQLGEIRSRLAAGKKVGRLTQGDLYRLMEQCRVDGERARTVSDVDLIVATVERAQLRQQLAHRWAEWGARLGAPVPGVELAPGPARAEASATPAEPELWAGRLLADAIDALDWERRRWPVVAATLAQVFPDTKRAADARRLGELAGAVEACASVLTADRLDAQRRALDEWLTKVAADPTVSPAVHKLVTAWRADDLGAWDEALVENARLWTIRPDAVRFAELHGRLAAVAPQWAAAVDAGEPQALPGNGEAALRAWRWRQAQTWFDETVGGVDTAALGRRVERCRERIRRLTHDLVVRSAWLEVALTLDDRKKAALADWTAALRKIGKGTGKTAAHWQAVAQRAMGEAVTAVPVWVMSIDRALEQFRGGAPLFDVVIVDEASQADIFALPVLSLAQRAVVVGDDQQIGPQLVGVPVDRVQALIATHLHDVPSAAHFDTESSLYDHAVRRSPERIMLVEHFRCVRPIIAFSSDTYYDRKIQPLRADQAFGTPLNPVFVPEGRRERLDEYGEVNVAEAEALVARVAAIVADPAYEGRTLGVVSLLSGSGQAAYLQHRLREEIGADVLARRELRVGDPYTFQGDERDVVLISMVVAAADGDFGAFTKRDYHRRINVAASRARDQLWLFHSVRLGDLHADDARALLLAHCLRPGAGAQDATRPEERCESDMQRSVLRRLQDRGLAPVPQFRIGSYRIDFVMATPDGRRLAVECDDDRYDGADAFAADLRRQAILERVGNCVFVRLRASLFHRDPDRALEPVWARAEEMGALRAP